MTGRDNLIENAQIFQDEVKKTIYDNFVIVRYGGMNTGMASTSKKVDGFDLATISLPEMRYQYPTLAQSLQDGWIDILLLFLFNILFFVTAFIKFRKYDVR